MDDQVKLAFASVGDLTKQLITLATGVLTLEVGFAKVFFEKAVSSAWQAPASWLLLLLSLVAGVWTLMALTGTLAAPAAPTAASVFDGNIRLPACLQVLFFILGVAMSTWFVWVALS
jgi:hypothetical protein